MQQFGVKIINTGEVITGEDWHDAADAESAMRTEAAGCESVVVSRQVGDWFELDTATPKGTT